MRTSLTALVAALLLTACSSDDRTTPALGQVALNMARARIGADVETADAAKEAPKVTRAQMEALGQPVVFASVPRLGTGLPTVQVASNGPFRTFMGADKATVTLNAGIVTATRGLPVDLIAQDLSLSPRSLFTGKFPKTYKRSQRHLTGEGTLATSDFACAIAPMETDETLELFGKPHRVRQFTELCKNKTRAFQNSYWVERPAGIVWQSHQSVSQAVGHIVLQRVVR